LPTGYVVAFKHMCESATAQCFRQEQISLSPGAILKINGQIRIDGGLDHSAWAPRIEIIGCDSDPLADVTKTPLATASVAQPNGSVSTYQAVTVSFTNTSVLPRVVLIRISAKRASGNVYSVYSRDVNYPSQDDVRSGTSWGYMGITLTGNMTLPAVGDVRLNTQYGTSGTQYTGNVVLPAVTGVLNTVSFGTLGTQYTGTATLPAIGKVVLGTSFGAGGTQYAGTVVMPGSMDVRYGTGYGAGGTEFTGIFDARNQGGIKTVWSY
jgi:hypothetical protein